MLQTSTRKSPTPSKFVARAPANSRRHVSPDRLAQSARTLSKSPLRGQGAPSNYLKKNNGVSPMRKSSNKRPQAGMPASGPTNTINVNSMPQLIAERIQVKNILDQNA